MPPRFSLDILSLYWNEFRDVSTRPQSFPICRQNHLWDHAPPQMHVLIPWLWHQSRFAVHQCLRLALSSLQEPQRVRQLWWSGELQGLPTAEDNAPDSFSALPGVSRCYRRADRQYPVKNISICANYSRMEYWTYLQFSVLGDFFVLLQWFVDCTVV